MPKRVRVRREKIISIRMTEGQWQTLAAQAYKEFITPSELIRFSVAEYLARRGVDIVAYRVLLADRGRRHTFRTFLSTLTSPQRSTYHR